MKSVFSCLSLLLTLASPALVSVNAAAASLPTVSISANPTSITSGGSSTLTVHATNATSVTVNGTNGSKRTISASGGTVVVAPTSTTTYTATATGSGGTASASVKITVGTASSAPTVTVTANPTTITAGSSSSVTVHATNATSVTLNGTNGSKRTLSTTGGTVSVAPTSTTTYTATATGSGGTASANVTITVGKASSAPTVTITANPTSISKGGSSVVTVHAANATSVTIDGTNGSKRTVSATGGVVSVSPTSTTTYTATATGSGGTASASVTIVVGTNPAPTVTLGASPASITSGSSSTLSMTAMNATQVSVTGSDGSSYTFPSASSGSESVSPTKTTTYTATASGPGGTSTATATVTVTSNPAPTVDITANPAVITSGNSSTLTVTATNATSVTLTGSDNSSYSLSASGGTQSVSPTSTTTYTATATGSGGTAKDSTTITVNASGNLQSVDHVIFMLQENHSFDNYLGMLNPYRVSNGWNIGDDGNTYTIDGIDDKLKTISNKDDEGTFYSPFKLKSTCVDDMSSAWLESYGDVNTYDFLATRPILMNGFVHNAEGFAKSCASSGSCSGSYTDTTGQRSMGYYDQGFLNYYYYMASQFAVSDRWFSPVSDKTVDNRIATYTGGTTQGLVEDPTNEDHLPQLSINTIFQELDNAKVSWKIYYTVTDGSCLSEDDCPATASARHPAVNFSELSYSYKYLHGNTTGTCTAPTVSSTAVGDSTGSFCIDPDHIAPLSQYYTDLTNGTLPSFVFIEAGYGVNDEHPGSAGNVLVGQAEVAKVINAFMDSPEWKDSIFFFSYDEGGGPYDHVPPVPGHSNAFTDASLGTLPDISAIAVDPDSYNPCLPPSGTPTTHCDLKSSDPGANSGDAAAQSGFAAQLGFRVPNIIISPFARRHYVSHIPMDHTAVIKFVENRFIGPSAHLTARDAAQPDLLDFFDFNNIPWATPPTPPSPVTSTSLGYNPCTPASMGP